MTTLFDIPVTTIDGQVTTLKPYAGRVLLVVNVASRCGFTRQYAELEGLYREYEPRGLTVLGFPCDQFFHQEPGSNAEIKALVDSCFRVTFPMFAKIDVNGPNRAPLYAYLAQHIEKKPLKLIPWNFSKVLVDANGRVLRRYLPTKSFKAIKKDLDKLLYNL